tara:strand:- start:1526 stop:3160 length:1635 start_codon:yes stop_codon:yes gene_type:complete
MKVSQKEIYSYLIQKGLTRNHALGILANIKAESNFNAAAKGDKNVNGEFMSFGLFQHYDTRRDALLEYMKNTFYKDKNWETNWKAQIDFALQEKAGQDYVKETFDTPQEASKSFTINFEKPGSTKKAHEKAAEERLSYFDDIPEEEEAAPVQYQEVMGPDGQMITIPIGGDVTADEIQSAKDTQEAGIKTYQNWREVYDDENLQRSKIIKVGPNKYKWQPKEGADQNDRMQGNYLMVDDNGDFIPFKNNELQLVEQNAAIQEKLPVLEKQQETQEQKQILEGDISTEQPTVATEEAVNEVTEEPSENVKDQKPEEPVTQLQQAKQAGSALLKGAGAVLDAVGGPMGIISYVMGKRGLKEAMKEIEPKARPELSPMFMEHFRQTKELAKKGFHPSEEMKFRKALDKSYQVGLENAIRGSGGQRARFLAQSGVLDAQRSAALLDYAVKDDELQRKNQDKYEKMMLFKENFDIQRTEMDRLEDMERQQRNKDAASKFTAAAFTNALSGLRGASFSGLVDSFLNPKKNNTVQLQKPAIPTITNQNTGD